MNSKEIKTKYEISKSIENTRKGFEESFEEGTLYNRQTQDKAHLERILHFLNINDGMKILDLGTGTGYLAFPITGRYPKAEIIGLDIVQQALDKNQDSAFMLLLDEESRSHVKSLLFQRTLIGVVAVHADKIQFCQDFLSVIEHA